MSILSAATSLTREQQQEQRLYELTQLASAEGILGPKHNALVPNGLKTGFMGLVDFLSRPNYAIAGMFDVLQGTGRPDETIGGRVLRELFSGVGGIKGDKEAFGEVLEQSGIGEGGRLSNLIGENWLTERLGFDPTLRGTVALGMDIFLDPTTYITFGSNGVMQVVTKGGKAKWLTKQASAPVREAARARWRRLAKGIDTWEGLGGRFNGRESQLWVPEVDVGPRSWLDELDGAIRKGDFKAEERIMGEIEQRMLSRKHSRMVRDDVFEMRTGWLREKINEQARQDVLKFAEGGELAEDIGRGLIGADAHSLVAKQRLRFFGKEIPGVSEPLAEGFDKVRSRVDDAINSNTFLRATKGEATKVVNAVGQFFNRDWALRNLPGVKVYLQTMRNNYGAHRKRIKSNLDAIFGAEVDTDTDFWHKLTRALDNPEAHLEGWVETAASKGYNEEWAYNKLDEVKLELRRAVDLDVHLGLLDPKLVLKNYIPHQTSKNDMLTESTFTEFLTGQGKKRQQTGAGSIGGYSEPRIYDTLDEFEEAIAKFKETNPDAEIDVILDPRRLLEDRLLGSARAWERQKFINKLRTSVKRNYFAELRNIVEKEMPHLRQIIEEAQFTDDEARTLLDAFESELVYWKQPTARLVETADGSIRAEQAPADARAPQFRRARSGEDSQTQMRREAIRRMVNEEYEQRPAVMAARDLTSEAAAAESRRRELGEEITKLDDTRRLVDQLKREVHDEETIAKIAQQAEKRQVAIKTMDEAMASMKESLGKLTSEAQHHTFELAKDDTLAQLELAMGRELGDLRLLEDNVRTSRVLAESDHELWEDFNQYAAENNIDVESLDNYHAWLSKRAGYHLGEMQKTRNAQKNIADSKATLRPITERNTDEWAGVTRTRAYMDMDEERLQAFGVDPGKADPKVVEAIQQGESEPTATLRYIAGKDASPIGADVDIARGQFNKGEIPKPYAGGTTDEYRKWVSSVIGRGDQVTRSATNLTDAEIGKLYEIIGRAGDGTDPVAAARANAAIELLDGANTVAGRKSKRTMAARKHAIELRNKYQGVAEAGGDAEFVGTGGKWVASSPSDTATLAAYAAAGKQAKVRFVGKGARSPQAQQDFAQTVGRSRAPGDLGTAGTAARTTLAASRKRVLGSTSKGKTPAILRRTRQELDDIEQKIDDRETRLAELEATATQRKREYDVQMKLAESQMKKSGKLTAKMTKDVNRKKSAWEDANGIFNEAKYTTDIEVRKLQKQADNLRANVDELDDVVPTLDHTAAHKQYQAERMRIQQAMDERAKLAARRDEIHRNHVFRTEQAATDVSILSAQQKAMRKKSLAVQRKLAEKLARVRESLAYSLELEQELLQRRRTNRELIDRYRQRKRAINREAAPLREERSRAYNERVEMRKQARELLKGEKKLNNDDLEELLKMQLLASSEDVRGTFVYGMLSNIEGLRELEGFLTRHGELVESLSPGTLARMREATDAANQQTIDPRTGQKWVDVWVGRTKSVTDLKDARALELEEAELRAGMSEAEQLLADGDLEGLEDILGRDSAFDDADMDPMERLKRLEELLREIAGLEGGIKKTEAEKKKFLDGLRAKNRAKIEAAKRLEAEGRIPPGHVRRLEKGVGSEDLTNLGVKRRDAYIDAVSKGSDGVLDWIVDSVPSKYQAWTKTIVSELREPLRRIHNTVGIDYEVHYKDPKTNVWGVELLNGSRAEGFNAQHARSYNPGEHLPLDTKGRLTSFKRRQSMMGLFSLIPGHEVHGGKLRYALSLPERAFQRSDHPLTVLHELIHAATVPQLHLMELGVSRGKFGAGHIKTEDSMRALAMVRELWQQVKPHMAQAGFTHAGMESLEEFITYGLTSPGTVKFLKSINVDAIGPTSLAKAKGGDTMWTKFLGAVRRIIGLPESDAFSPQKISVWDSLLSYTSTIAESPVSRRTIKMMAEAPGADTVWDGMDYAFEHAASARSQLDDMRLRPTSQKATTSTIGAARQKAATGKRPKLEHWRVPADVAEAMKQLDNTSYDTEEARNLLKLYDIALNSFKEWVTVPFPAFHFRNAYANVAAIALDIRLAALDPRKHKETIDILRGGEGTIVLGDGTRMTYDHVRSLLAANDMVPDASDLLEMTGKGTSRRSVISGNNPITRPVRKHFLNPMTNLGKGIEAEARALHFVELLRRGMDHHAAGERVKQFLFDYSNLSDKEKVFMRRIFPFYTWQSKNIRRQIHNLYERPGMVTAQAKPLRDRGPENDALPEYLRGELQVRLEGDFNTPVKRLTNIDLPISELSLMWQGSLDKTFMGFLNQMNPLLKAPLEIAFNMDTFNGRTVNGRQWMGRNGPFLDKFPGWFKDAIELQKVQRADGTVGYTANGTKTHLLFKTWAVSRVMNTLGTAELFRDPSASPSTTEDRMFAFWKLITGLEFREYDLTQFQKEVLRNRIERLEQELLDRGVLRKFQKVYAPASPATPIGNTP